ncbi:MAG: DUF3047 domain-containing protein [Elusimicrobia bacterium]|nr:DUF3047 domain-containing protein [Elusimicrobiota bacterium]
MKPFLPQGNLFIATVVIAVFLAGFAGAKVTFGQEPPSKINIDFFPGDIEPEGLPKGWKSLFFKKIKKHTLYSVEEDAGNYFVKAMSSGSASAILKEVSFDLTAYPILTWRWKVENILREGNALKKSGDDYPARIYVAFAYNSKLATAGEKIKYGLAKKIYGSYPPFGALNYIWDNRLPIGIAVDNAYTDKAKMIVVESGPEKTGQWIKEKRNVYEDFKRLFKKEPPQAAFVALMADTDNTGESATAYFDDIAFEPVINTVGEKKGRH